MDKPESDDLISARRRFLARCGKFAIVTPPAISVLLSSTAQNYATAASGQSARSLSFGSGGLGNNGFGNGGGDGVPGRSGSNPSPRASEKEADDDR